MASKNKTKPTRKSVRKYIESIDHERRQQEAFKLLALFEKITGMKAVMWGESIIGFGVYSYKYATGREGDWPITGFSPRKTKHSIYIMPGFKRYADLLDKLGKYKTSVSCLYINKLEDIDMKVLEKLIQQSFEYMQTKYETKAS